MSDVLPIIVPSELRSAICPNCGYSLQGLKLEDKCPECGREPNPSEIVLYGQPRSEELDNAVLWRRWWVLPTILLVAVLFFWLRPSTRSLAVFAIASGCLQFARRHDRRHPGLIQIRIYPEGVVQYHHSGGATFLNKVRAAYAWMLPVMAASLLVIWIVTHPGIPEAVVFVPLFVIVAIFSVSTLRKARRYYAAQRKLPENAIVDFNTALRAITPWSGVDEFLFQSEGQGRFLLQMYGPYKYQMIDTRDQIVDAVVELNDSEADLLQKLIRTMISESRKRKVSTTDGDEPSASETS